jgi:D-alanine--poly(phosphoribitol) ligase subunit 2
MIAPGLSDKILRRLVSICGTDAVCTNPDLPLYEGEFLDSMKTVELMLAMEEDFGLHVSPAEFERQMWATPRRIIADIQHRLTV